jgi:hypothetical protein
MASTYPSSQWATLRRSAIPAFAGSDIVQGAPVCIASGGDDQVVMCTSANQKPIGVARDYAIAGNAVTVYDDGNVVRTNIGGNGAGASFSRQAYVGVIGTSSITHPQSGVAVSTPVLGAVAGGSPLGVGGVGSQIWAVGVAYESAAVGDWSAFRVEPRLLSGLVSN